MFQNNNEQLELIATLYEKYDLQSLTKCENWKKNQLWKKISEDMETATNIKKTGKQWSTKWGNKMETLRNWERSIRQARKKTGKKESD